MVERVAFRIVLNVQPRGRGIETLIRRLYPRGLVHPSVDLDVRIVPFQGISSGSIPDAGVFFFLNSNLHLALKT